MEFKHIVFMIYVPVSPNLKAETGIKPFAINVSVYEAR